jgi:glyoxylase-like metal-dependent hydrolase (beta-lactamase superfamily II)
MDRLWGEFLPVPQDNLRVLVGGECVAVGGEEFQVAYTPGHASHHVSYLHQGTAFVGDVGGVRIMPESLTIPPTPPPDIDLEAWHRSLDLVRGWQPDRLAFAHFGLAENVDSQLEELARRLDGWAAMARQETQEEFITRVHAEIETEVQPGTTPAYEQAAPAEQLYAGLTRYWAKRAEREAT